MPVASPSLLTTEDYRMLPDSGPRYQLVEGELYMSPAPTRYHQIVSRNLQFILMKYLEKNPRGELYNAPFDVYLSEHDVVQPDLVFIQRENFSVLTDAGVKGTPDFVVEILSPSNAYLDKKNKLRVYARTGVKELWTIDPDPKTILVYQLQENASEPSAIFSEKDSLNSDFFPGLKIRGTEIFKRRA